MESKKPTKPIKPTEPIEQILSILSPLKPKVHGRYIVVECPSCGKHRAFCYPTAGIYSQIICNRQNKCSFKMSIKDHFKINTAEHLTAEHLSTENSSKEEAFRKHGLCRQELIGNVLTKEGYIPLPEEWEKKLLWNQKEEKFTWFNPKGFSSSIAEFYPVLHPCSEELWVLEGEWDLLKAITDGLSCTSSLFGCGYIPQTEQGLDIFVPFGTIKICYDVDQAGQNASTKLAISLKEKFPQKRIEIVKLPFQKGEGEGKDYCDFRQQHKIEDVLNIKGVVVEEEEKKQTKKKVTYETIKGILRELGYQFSLCDLDDNIYFTFTNETNKSAVPKRLDDIEEAKIRSKVRDYYLARKIMKIEASTLSDAIVRAASESKFHPIKDYLLSLKWDGKDHIGELAKCFESQSDIFQRFFTIWGTSAVRRIVENGHQVPVLVLIGGQSLGKSFFARWICPLQQYFKEGPIRTEDKDHRLSIATTWIWAIEELGATTRKADVESLKAFLTQEKIKERKPYGKYEIVKPAITAFLGTVNEAGGFLVDQTGNRRFLSCPVFSINWEYTNLDKNQIWAQLVHGYHQKEYEMTKEEISFRNCLNEEEMIPDPVEVILEEIVSDGEETDFVSSADLLSAFQERGMNPSRTLTSSLATILRKLGKTKGFKKIKGKTARGYFGIKKT